MAIIDYLPASAATLYAELLQQSMSAEAQRTLGDLRGTFVFKTVKGRRYVYLQYHETGRQKQVYLGPESRELTRLMERFDAERLAKRSDRAQRARLSTMLREGGATVPDPLSGRILELMADGGIFRLGAVLVGSHAFAAYANVLGVKWPDAVRTQDIDVAQDRLLSMALARNSLPADLPGILDRAQLGFHPVPGFHLKDPSTSFKIRGREIHLDLLAPSSGHGNKPIALPALKTAAQPLRYLDYLIEKTEPAVIPYGDGVLVNIPAPARFAFHKLIVARERPTHQRTKSRKDILQAESLFHVLGRDRPGDISMARRELEKRGTSWLRAARSGATFLSQGIREISEL